MAAERRLGPYVLREQVATRALTVTYRAEHVDLGRQVLVKTLKDTVSASSAFAAALEREARILARVRHPNIVEIHDFRREDGAIWLVLEALSGPTLAALRARAGHAGVPGRLDPDAAAAIALEIARGLGHAHDLGVVHRELRPEHVLITLQGAVKILELSGATDGRLPSLPEPFEGSETFARPEAMAPEQILGEPVGPPADVFALGVILFELLAGAGPFDAPEGRAGPDRAQRIRSELPQPLRALAPDVPRGLERVVLRCLEKDPEQRFPDGRAVALALEDALAERTHLAPRVFIARALAAAGFGAEAPVSALGIRSPPGRRAVAQDAADAGPRPRPLAAEIRSLAAIGALVVLGGVIVELGVRDRDVPDPAASGSAPAGPGGEAAARGYLRVLARPWAEVIVDGDPVDVTPIARPIPVAPGRHFVTFRHPNAPDEKRTVVIAAGQTVLLDVGMRVDRGAVDAGAGPAADAAVSP